MDFSSIIGIIAGIGFVLVGYGMNSGNVMGLLMANAFVIVIGGTLGAVFLSYGMNNLKNFPKLFLEVFKSPKSTINETIDYLVSLSQTAKQNGLLSLEKNIMATDSKKKVDPFLKRGILSVVDGTDPEKINELLQNEIYVYEQKKSVDIAMFDSCASFAPAFGMIGTIVGLIQMLSAGMSDPDALTSAIGVAFITTLYGSLFANCIFAPSATKLRSKLASYRLEKEMIIDAVCAIRNGVNPKMLKEQLSSYAVLSAKSTKKQSAKPKVSKKA
ncbi:hypothetical protein EOM82_08300 [bacterium]|nr:hypothetical protein [bacterium]